MDALIIAHHYTQQLFGNFPHFHRPCPVETLSKQPPHIAVYCRFTHRKTESRDWKRSIKTRTLSLLSPWRKYSPIQLTFFRLPPSPGFALSRFAADKLGNLPWEANEPRVELWRTGRTFSKPLFGRETRFARFEPNSLSYRGNEFWDWWF